MTHFVCDMTHCVCDITHFVCDMTNNECDTTQTTHGGDQTSNIWISRSVGLPNRCLSDRDSVYSTEKVVGILGTPVKSCLICMRTPVKTCSIIWQL